MRIRTIKPEFWRHEVMAQLAPETQLMAIALLNMADDEGYFEANPRIVRGEIMPFRDDLATISRDCRELSRVGWVEVRETSGHGLVGRIVNWTRHQRVDHPKKSKLSVYFDASDSRDAFARTSREPREASREEQGTGNREVEQGSGGEARATPPVENAPPVAAFEVEQPDVAKIESWTKEDFWRAAECTRRELGYPPQRWPNPVALSRWWGEARGVADVAELGAAFEDYARSKYAIEKRPPAPFEVFMKSWNSHLQGRSS